MSHPKLYIIIPCYNEQEVIPLTSQMFLSKLNELISKELIHEDSRILFVNDGSKDKTWDIITHLVKNNFYFEGISLSRNKGHQNALLAGLMEAKEKCDITISIDCDGQDDIHVMNDMIEEYSQGCEIVYGVRSERKTDTFFKRTTAQCCYKFLNKMGVDVYYNHADYRLVSSRVLNEFANFKEVNLFLRGMFPLVGYKSTCVYYKREERIAGTSHYPLSKMLALAFDGMTSLSIKPLRIITFLGLLLSFFSFLGIIWAIFTHVFGNSVSGWSSLLCVICLLGGVQMIAIGILGEYIGKIYLEVKARPRYIIEERIGKDYEK